MKKHLSLLVPLLALILALPQSAWATSPTKSVDVYQNATKSITKILYYLPTNEKGNDNKYYSAIDMGYGVAWADKNIGADAEDEAGTYFYWGDIEGHTTFSSSQALDVSSGYTLGTELSVELDAAYKKIGSNWRIPTPDDFIALRDNTIKTNNEKFTSNAKDNYIIIPGKGGYEPTNSLFYNGWQHYWTNTFAGKTSRYGVAQIFTRTDDNDYYVQNKLADDENYARCYYGMPIRAIYKPSFTIRTLTIHIKNGEDMVYKCEDGQTISVNAVANTAEKYVFDKWSDNNSTSATRDFVMTGGDLETTATFKDDPAATTHTVTFKDYDGTTLNTYSLIEGRTPDYRGETISRVGYEFTGWTPSITPLGNADVTYTATYKKQKLFTITNTHTSEATNVAMKRSSSSAPSPIFKIRILDKDDNVTTDWTEKNFSGTTATSFGSIPAGGKMEIFGNNSSGLNSAGNTDTYGNYVNFSQISGGTPHLSGNILSLVACSSDGLNINNNFELPYYCFYYLFQNTGVVNAEDLELPSLTLSPGAYAYMFNNCTSLTTPPRELPATIMTYRCYWEMFSGCTALTKSPSVCGQTTDFNQNASGTWGSMYSMFARCSNLSQIRIYLAGWNVNYGTHLYWCGSVASGTNVASDGILYCPPTLQRKFGAQPELSWDYCHYMPQGNSTHWSTIYSYNITFVAKGGNWSDATSYNKQFTWKTDVSDVNSFLDTESPEGYYTDAACTTPITITEIRALLGTQQEDDVETTKYIYAKFASSSTLTVTVASNNTAFGTVNESEINGVESGTGITVSGSTLTIGSTTVTAKKHADDAQYTYAFTGWTDDEGEDLPKSVTDDLAIRANFTRTTNQYTLNVSAGDNGSVSGGGTYDYGTNQEITATADEGYHFVQWQDGNTDNPRTINVTNVTAATTYTATFAVDVTNYDLTFRAGENGSVSGTAASAAIAAGTPHSIAENTAISLTATANTFYQFKEWQNTSTHEKVSDKTTYNFNLAAATDLTAVFEIANPLVLIDNENEAYYKTYDDLVGTENVNVQISRNISENMWSTICLPFDVDLEAAGNEGYNGKFYKYMGATGDYNGIDLHFTPTGYVDANTPYLFRSDAPVTQLDFANVTLQARQVKDEGTIGNVTFRGTILPQTLNDVEGHTILGLYNNLIYYPNTTSGTYIRAFRGYFIVDGMAGVQPRVRIVVQDNNATPIEVIELGGGETKTPVRKYVEDGVMIIEKNGVRYSVTGQEMK